MSIAIWGAGAVGLGLASTLARPGERLKIVGRNPDSLRCIKSLGVRRTGLFGYAQIDPDQLTLGSDPASLADDPADWLLICTKACSSTEIAASLAPIAHNLTSHTRLVLCQNGWGNETPYLPFWPTQRLFHARIITGFHKRSEHEVEITAHASPIALGSIFGTPVDACTSLAARITEGGIPAETSPNMRAVLWAKMLYNCALNPLGALAGRPYGALIDDPTTRTLVEAVIREIFHVMSAEGITLEWNDAADYLEVFYSQLIPPTAAHESSMLQDLRAGRPTEIEVLNGAVERLAVKHGIPTPVTSALAALLRVAQTRDRRKKRALL